MDVLLECFRPVPLIAFVYTVDFSSFGYFHLRMSQDKLANTLKEKGCLSNLKNVHL